MSWWLPHIYRYCLFTWKIRCFMIWSLPAGPASSSTHVYFSLAKTEVTHFHAFAHALPSPLATFFCLGLVNFSSTCFPWLLQVGLVFLLPGTLSLSAPPLWPAIVTSVCMTWTTPARLWIQLGSLFTSGLLTPSKELGTNQAFPAYLLSENTRFVAEAHHLSWGAILHSSHYSGLFPFDKLLYFLHLCLLTS